MSTDETQAFEPALRPTGESTQPLDREHRLDEVIAAYLRAVRAGEVSDQQEWLARHSDLAPELAEFFADQERVERLAGPVRAAVTAGPPVGTKVGYVGDYELLEELGRGGMGVVYKARQVSLKRTVALKMILAGVHASKQDLARFRAEAEAVARLQHPHIVQIHEIGEHEGHPYAALEFVAGGSLDRKLHGSPLPVRQAAHLLEVLARAVHAAHQQGIIHRDLKPANVLLAPSERPGAVPLGSSPEATGRYEPKVTDFGLAKLVKEEAGQTRSGSILGTPSYMAPEQAAGKTREIGPAADIYALGAILYELLTGRPPFRAETPLDTLMQVVSEEPVSPRQLQPKLPRDLETVCLKCLQKDPRKRYASAAALGDDLRRFLDGRPIVARPVGPLGQAWRWCRRNPVVAALAAAVVLSMVGGTAVSAYFAVEASHQARLALGQKGEAEGERNKAVAAERATAAALEGERLTSYAHGIALAHRAYLAGEYRQARLLLQGCPAEHRHWEWRHLRRLLHGQLSSFDDHGGQITGAAFSPDGRHVASVTTSHLRVWDSATGREIYNVALRKREQLKGGGYSGQSITAGVAFSPGGDRIVTCSYQHMTVHDARDGRELTHVRQEQTWVNGVAFGPGGERIAGACTLHAVREGGGQVVVWDATTGAEVKRLAPTHRAAVAVAFAPDGKSIAAAVTGVGGELPDPGEVRVWGLPEGQELHVFKVKEAVRPGAPTYSMSSVAFDPGGGRVIAGCSDGKVYGWELPTGKRVLELGEHPKGVSGIAFGPGGKQIASVGYDRIVRLWDARSGTEQKRFIGHTFPLWAVSFAPDGRRVVSAGGMQRSDVPAPHQEAGEALVWDVVAPQPVRTFRDRSLLSPSWRYLAVTKSGGGDSTVVVHDLKTGAVLPHSLTVGMAGTVVWGPDGNTLAATTTSAGANVWDRATGELLAHLPGQRPPEPGTRSYHHREVALSPDGRRAVLKYPSTLSLWDVKRTRPVQNIPTALLLRAFEPVKDVAFAFSPDSRWLATSAENENSHPEGKVRLWDTETGEERIVLEGGGQGLAFSPDGRRLASWTRFGGRGLVVWNVEDGRVLFEDKKTRLNNYTAVFSPDGRFLAGVTSDGHAVVWNTDDGSVALTTQPQVVTGRLTFSPDGTRLACGTLDGSLLVGDLTRGRILFASRGHDDSLLNVVYSPDGRRLVTSARDLAVKIWEAESGRELLSFRDHGPRVDPPGWTVVVAFGPDGDQLLSRVPPGLILRDGRPLD